MARLSVLTPRQPRSRQPERLLLSRVLKISACQLGDVYDLQFPDASFKVVHAHQVLHHLSDPAAALREMGRVCVPGGFVAARDADYEP